MKRVRSRDRRRGTEYSVYVICSEQTDISGQTTKKTLISISEFTPSADTLFHNTVGMLVLSCAAIVGHFVLFATSFFTHYMYSTDKTYYFNCTFVIFPTYCNGSILV